MSISDDILIENFNTPVDVDDLEEGKIYRLVSRRNADVNILAKLDQAPNSGYAGWIVKHGGPYYHTTSAYNYFKEDPVTTDPKTLREGDLVRLTHKTTANSSFLGTVAYSFSPNDDSVNIDQPGSKFQNSYLLSEFDIALVERAKTSMDKFHELPIGGKFRMRRTGNVFVKVSENDAVNTANYFEPTEEHFLIFEKVD